MNSLALCGPVTYKHAPACYMTRATTHPRVDIEGRRSACHLSPLRPDKQRMRKRCNQIGYAKPALCLAPGQPILLRINGCTIGVQATTSTALAWTKPSRRSCSSVDPSESGQRKIEGVPNDPGFRSALAAREAAPRGFRVCGTVSARCARRLPVPRDCGVRGP